MSPFARILRPILNLFSSVKFGIALLVMLFIYSSIGSAGILYPTSPVFWDLDNWEVIIVREKPWFEKTEFAWFSGGRS